MVSTEALAFMVVLYKKKSRFRPRLIGALEVPGRCERRAVALWCLSALLLFGPFAGQGKRGFRVGVCYCNHRL